jgi:hypothetical protein
MSLQDLSERMGHESVDEESVRMMRDELCEIAEGEDTADIDQETWNNLLNECVH